MKKFSALEFCVKWTKMKDLPIPGSAEIIKTFSLFFRKISPSSINSSHSSFFIMNLLLLGINSTDGDFCFFTFVFFTIYTEGIMFDFQNTNGTAANWLIGGPWSFFLEGEF